ncbi:MAG: GNAT family N-acetyltransferase, partial [Chloroflexi bacterium]
RATLLAGSIFFTFGSTVSYAFTGWDRASHSLRANDLIHAEMIEAARREGYRTYDFGEVAGGQQTLAAFKGKWGAQPRQLYHCVYPPQGEEEESGLESGRLHGLAATLWRRMPLELTARAGDLVYRFL